jgi:hypothetical protein
MYQPKLIQTQVPPYMRFIVKFDKDLTIREGDTLTLETRTLRIVGAEAGDDLNVTTMFARKVENDEENIRRWCRIL